MPELPEVETTRRGLAPHLQGRRIDAVVLRRPDLRWPIPPDVVERLPGQRITAIRRRAKYLLLDTAAGSALLHLGMSGSLRVLPRSTPVGPHDHVDLVLAGAPAWVLRFNDPRRFGSLLWTREDPLQHPLLRSLAPEPLSSQFNGAYLARAAAGRSVAIKQLIMNGQVVVGVGNIYASEALFRAGINPRRSAKRIKRAEFDALAKSVKAVLRAAIRAGGTTLRDYVNPEGTPGYFRQKLYVYERTRQPCRVCHTPIRQLTQGQRSTYFCPKCQK